MARVKMKIPRFWKKPDAASNVVWNGACCADDDAAAAAAEYVVVFV